MLGLTSPAHDKTLARGAPASSFRLEGRPWTRTSPTSEMISRHDVDFILRKKNMVVAMRVYKVGRAKLVGWAKSVGRVLAATHGSLKTFMGTRSTPYSYIMYVTQISYMDSTYDWACSMKRDHGSSSLHNCWCSWDAHKSIVPCC